MIATHLFTSLLLLLAPNDPFFPKQWSLSNDGTQTVTIEPDDLHTIEQVGRAGVDIGWLKAQPALAGRTLSPITVAVIDSGVDPTHPDLKDRLAPGGIDLLAPPQPGPSPTPVALTDPLGHGTHVTGIIAAATGNGTGISGVAPASVRVLPIRTFSNDFVNFVYRGKLISDYAADAIRYAVAHQARVINMSFGWPEIVHTANVKRAIADAVAAGVLIVASAGNDRKTEPTYPCVSDGVLCVGAVSNNGETSLYSNRGGRVDLQAPGDGILSLYPLAVESVVSRIQGYEILSGSSQATPLVAGIAATLLSVNPNLSLSELKARILASARFTSVASDALYGVPDLSRALTIAPEPVLLPEFKDAPEVLVENGQAQGTFNIRSLWATATNTRAVLKVNGAPAGTASAPSLAQGAALAVAWAYPMPSLDQDSTLELELEVTYDTQTSTETRDFSLELPAARKTESILTTTRAPAPGVKNTDWLGANNGHLFSKLRPVDRYGLPPGLPSYYRQTSVGPQGAGLQIFDPSSQAPVAAVVIPFIQQISEVIRMDVDGNGNPGWVVTGLEKDANQNFTFEFYFLNASFQPVWGDASAWRIGLDSTFGPQIVKSYGQPGSWLRNGDRLVPAFLGTGTLPTLDGFDSLDPRHYRVDSHLYYLAPKAHAPAGAVTLQLRALDSATFRRAQGDVHVENLIPQDNRGQAVGHLRLLLGVGDGLTAPESIWDVVSTESSSLAPALAWDTLSANGQALPAFPDGQSAFLSFYDVARGSVAWSDLTGAFLGRTEFVFSEPEDWLVRMIGGFNFDAGAQAKGRIAFLESRFHLVAIHEPAPGSPLEVRTIPIQRDSSFPGTQFSDLFSPVSLSVNENPVPGVYVDSTLVVGNRVSVVTWNTQSSTLSKPLRYSLSIPANCVQMPPFSAPSANLGTSPATSVFSLPMICAEGTEVALHIVTP